MKAVPPLFSLPAVLAHQSVPDREPLAPKPAWLPSPLAPATFAAWYGCVG